MASDTAQTENPTRDIIAMAWDLETSFETLKSKTCLSDSELIFLLSTHMQPSSFRRWRTQRGKLERMD